MKNGAIDEEANQVRVDLACQKGSEVEMPDVGDLVTTGPEAVVTWAEVLSLVTKRVTTNEEVIFPVIGGGLGSGIIARKLARLKKSPPRT